MKITFIRPVTHTGGGRIRDVGEFDVEVAEGLTLQCLRLAISPEGKRFVFGPSKNGVKFARFSGDFAPKLAEAAFAELQKKGHVADDARAA